MNFDGSTLDTKGEFILVVADDSFWVQFILMRAHWDKNLEDINEMAQIRKR
jgi:hypothetical protein